MKKLLFFISYFLVSSNAYSINGDVPPPENIQDLNKLCTNTKISCNEKQKSQVQHYKNQSSWRYDLYRFTTGISIIGFTTMLLTVPAQQLNQYPTLPIMALGAVLFSIREAKFNKTAHTVYTTLEKKIK